MRNRLPFLFLLLACGVSLFYLFAIVDQEHNLYPAWSSLSSDAKGTSVWYESLSLDPDHQVWRNYQPLANWGSKQTVTMLILGVPLRFGPQDIERMLTAAESLASRGHRVVLSFDLQGMTPPVAKDLAAFQFLPKHLVHPVWSKENLHWNPQGSWRVLPASRGDLQVIERRLGSGSLVLIADSEVVSNQSLAKQPDVSLLLAVLSSSRPVVFDESHLGLLQTGTVMGLFRHYRLQGLLYGLLVLCALVIWRSSVPFPARTEASLSSSASTMLSDALDGFANLLARSIPAKDLVLECVRLRLASERNASLRSIITKIAADDFGQKQDPVQGFRRIQNALRRDTSTEIHP